MLNKLMLNKDGDVFEGHGEVHNWTNICGLWELPYMNPLTQMCNINGMYQEPNVDKSIVSTCMDMTDKTKYNMKVRKDMIELCNHPTLEVTESGRNPRASFRLKTKQKKEALRWFKKFYFLDGYIVGLR
jgi:hypothetical protein